ncbi:DUF6156 family protein [Pseudomaricurvus sp. HS19]|uniref:DUF6156 family protein n=1 Tax=Pseudomaricurvus sp. HS19 TaxID=2692626 RepID=UPI0019257A46|nr:DUF6156 family protein [Pseudomaricurvus sp. HS19]
MEAINHYQRYYLSYSGTGLPLQMVSPISTDEIANRNTFFGVCNDDAGRVTLIHKRVYGEVELEHRYGYDDQGRLQWAEIRALDDEACRLVFGSEGQLLSQEELTD